MNDLRNEPPAAQLHARVIQERIDSINAASEKAVTPIHEMRRMVLEDYNNMLNALTQTADRDNNLLTHLNDIARIVTDDITKMKDGGGLGPQGKAMVQEIAEQMKALTSIRSSSSLS